MVIEEVEGSCLNVKSMLGLGPVSAKAEKRGKRASSRTERMITCLLFVAKSLFLSPIIALEPIGIIQLDSTWEQAAIPEILENHDITSLLMKKNQV